MDDLAQALDVLEKAMGLGAEQHGGESGFGGLPACLGRFHLVANIPIEGKMKTSSVIRPMGELPSPCRTAHRLAQPRCTM